MGKNKEYDSSYEDYITRNELFLNEPIIKAFLKIDENNFLFENYIIEPTEENKQKLDKAFQSFYLEIRLISYLSKMIHYYSIDLNKRYKCYFSRYPLILDKPIDEEEKLRFIDYLQSEENSVEDTVFNKLNNNLLECIQQKNIYKALVSLSNKQLKVLELIYMYGLNNKLVAEYFGESPQNISKIHRRTLNILKKKLKKGVD